VSKSDGESRRSGLPVVVSGELQIPSPRGALVTQQRNLMKKFRCNSRRTPRQIVDVFAAIFISALALVGCSSKSDTGAPDGRSGRGGSSTQSDAGRGTSGPEGGASSTTGGTDEGGRAGSSTGGGEGGIAGEGAGRGDSQAAAGQLICAEPNGGQCPDDLIECDGEALDLTNDCWKPVVPLSCSAGATGAETCWVDTTTTTYYRLTAGPCMPATKWRVCNEMEKSMYLFSITKDCN